MYTLYGAAHTERAARQHKPSCLSVSPSGCGCPLTIKRQWQARTQGRCTWRTMRGQKGRTCGCEDAGSEACEVE